MTSTSSEYHLTETDRDSVWTPNWSGLPSAQDGKLTSYWRRRTQFRPPELLQKTAENLLSFFFKLYIYIPIPDIPSLLLILTKFGQWDDHIISQSQAILRKRFFSTRNFVIGDFCWPRRQKYTEKVISSTIRTNINLFRAKFLLKNIFFWRALGIHFSPESGIRERVRVTRKINVLIAPPRSVNLSNIHPTKNPSQNCSYVTSFHR